MNDLAARIAALSPEQRARFEESLKAKGLRMPQVDQIPRRPREDTRQDFGVDADSVLASLTRLDELRARYATKKHKEAQMNH